VSNNEERSGAGAAMPLHLLKGLGRRDELNQLVSFEPGALRLAAKGRRGGAPRSVIVGYY
jgi:hypothetical protein